MAKIGKMFAVLTAAILIGLMPSLVQAETCTVNGVTYTYTIKNGNATLGGGGWNRAVPTSTTGALTIPSSLNGYPVTGISDTAFYECKKLTAIVIPATVDYIGTRAFGDCKGLKSVTILGPTAIGSSAFNGCTSLAKVTLSDGVRFLNYMYWDQLVTTPSTNPFAVTKVEGFVVTKDGYGCTTVEDGVLFTDDAKYGKMLVAYPCGKRGDYTIPYSVERIWDMAFSGCAGLKSVIIPEGVKSIGVEAFYGCQALKTVTFMGQPPSITFSGTSLTSEAFSGISIDSFINSLSATGYYMAAYEKDWKAVLDANGKWYGMTMKKASSTSKKDTSKTDTQPVDLGVFTKARTFNGYVMDGEQYVGSIQVKAAKAKTNKKTGLTTSKFTVAVQVLGEKKVSLKGEYDLSEGAIEMETRDGHVLSLEMDDGATSFVGTFDDYDVEVVMDDGTKKSYALEEGAAFYVDTAALSDLLGDSTYEEYLPDGVEITTKGTKWSLPKAGKVVYNKKVGGIDESKLGENPSGLKLTFKSKDGTFKGSFKAYVDKNGKPKATTVSVSGFVVDGKGYGIATIKKLGSVPITIE